MAETPTRPRQPQSKAEFCPHLGLEEDEQTCLAYPSSWNLCHRTMPASSVRPGYQRKVCLSPAHITCPVLQGEASVTRPPKLRARRKASR